jgi:hypothetical protein
MISQRGGEKRRTKVSTKLNPKEKEEKHGFKKERRYCT